jgi:cytochrome c oxidase cbb3-type subunit 3/ubiquinol-cytochrome c reductase cytochrome c subunit
MKMTSIAALLTTCGLTLALLGCRDAPGKPKPGDEALRPEQVLAFNTLYKQNCSACHGEDGCKGAAISLSDAVYIATAGETTIQRITANGVAQTLMPAFAKSHGGMLTDQQVAVLAHGIVDNWGNSMTLNGQTPPPYISSLTGDPTAGFLAFTTFCARCHGADGRGIFAKTSLQPSAESTGSIVDPAYLALVSDQSLRSTIIAGRPEGHMPDWRSDGDGPNTRAMTYQEITDTVACWVRRVTAQDFQVFAINCAHLGCPVRWFSESKLFMCPCHGGAYYEDGSPERGLFECKYKISGDSLVIHAGEMPTLATQASCAEKPLIQIEPADTPTRPTPWRA